MLQLNRKHVADSSSNRIVRWDDAANTYTFSQRIGEKWVKTPITEPFALDVHLARHGFETWESETKTRHTMLAAVSDPVPEKIAGKATEIYSIPVISHQLGGLHELIIKGSLATAALCDLFDYMGPELASAAAQEMTPVPIIRLEIRRDEYSSRPVFHVVDWTDRPTGWATTIVDFAA